MSWKKQSLSIDKFTDSIFEYIFIYEIHIFEHMSMSNVTNLELLDALMMGAAELVVEVLGIGGGL